MKYQKCTTRPLFKDVIAVARTPQLRSTNNAHQMASGLRISVVGNEFQVNWLETGLTQSQAEDIKTRLVANTAFRHARVTHEGWLIVGFNVGNVTGDRRRNAIDGLKAMVAKTVQQHMTT